MGVNEVGWMEQEKLKDNKHRKRVDVHSQDKRLWLSPLKLPAEGKGCERLPSPTQSPLQPGVITGFE